MEATTSNDDVLVLLQTENGEQIALPMSALPNDFVPGDSGQIIMVESGLDEQQQEIVVESSDLTGSHDLVSLQHVDPNPHIPTLDLVPESTGALNEDDINDASTSETLTATEPTTSYADKPSVPRTYSKSTVKSYAPTCGPARIYQQCSPQQQQSQPQQQLQPHQQLQLQLQQQSDKSDLSTKTSTPEQIEEKPAIVPRCKQKRKEPLLLRPINGDEDMKLEYIVMKEPSPPVQEPEIKRRRKEHRIKKNRAKQLRQHNQQPQQAAPVASPQEQQPQPQIQQPKQEQQSPEPDNHQLQQQQPQTERRTRLSNTCRVATGKSYKCNDCDFSTDRINNIVLHVKEQCPKSKRKSIV